MPCIFANCIVFSFHDRVTLVRPRWPRVDPSDRRVAPLEPVVLATRVSVPALLRESDRLADRHLAGKRRRDLTVAQAAHRRQLATVPAPEQPAHLVDPA